MKELDFVSNSPVLSAQITLCKAEMSRVQGEPSKVDLLFIVLFHISNLYKSGTDDVQSSY